MGTADKRFVERLRRAQARSLTSSRDTTGVVGAEILRLRGWLISKSRFSHSYERADDASCKLALREPRGHDPTGESAESKRATPSVRGPNSRSATRDIRPRMMR
jgi:hypothetical protein